MNWWKPIIGVALLALGGCAAYDAGKAAVVDKASTVADEALATALLIKCRGATIGSIQRRYMQSQKVWELWWRECLGSEAPELPDPLPGPLPE